jgi:hypothetical protein
MKEQNDYPIFIEDTIISLYANMRDLREKLSFCDPEERDYINGRLFSYQEVIEIFRFGIIKYGLEKEIKI